jgi:hypothetical protein
VRDVDEGQPGFFVQSFQLCLHRQLELCVERSSRLVKQKKSRLDDKSTGDADSLPLAAGEIADFAVRQFSQPDPLQHGEHLALRLQFLHASNAQTVSDILEDIEMGKEREMLEDHGKVALVREKCGDVLPVDQDRSGRR